ncbi:MAG: alpha-2-macroglobulin, partial [Flavobacteriaceae bacterium]|nr:alpha-2-macroglobulin [Flavobacteriaceae bacterium]
TFEIVFKALPDLKVSPDTQPTFNYKVVADVTDINGETRSTETIVNVGYHALTASITVPQKIDKSEKEHSITITTNNLNGEFVPALGTLKIYKLKAPENVLRKRPWQAPDYQVISEDEFKKLFPHEAYNKEDNPQYWEKGELVYETDVDTEVSKEVALNDLSNWISGKYLAEFVCTDKFDQEVRDEQRFDVFSEGDTKVADNQLFFINIDKTDYQPSDSVKVRFGSASKDVSVTLTVEKNYTVIDTRIIHLSEEIKSISIPVKEKDRGGFTINYHLVNYNSFISGTLPIRVPYPKHELTIETSTFRDKLKPGQNETWSFTIKGSKSDEVTAEILASMYDASLDQFRGHQWGISAINYRYYYSYKRSNANYSFGTLNFRIQNLNTSRLGFTRQAYDQLNWFGFSFGYGNIRFKGQLNEDAVTGVAAEQKLERSDQPEGIQIEAVMADESEINESEDVTPSTNKDLINENVLLKEQKLSGIMARKNLRETAFFYPHLTTDNKGNVSFNFTVPESLTKWKLQLLAHTKDLQTATQQLTAVTQKELMVLPNPPRYFREGDRIVFATKIANLSDQKLEGISELQLYDALTNKPIDTELGNANNQRSFEVDAQGNASISWSLQIPDAIQAVKYKIVAKAGDFTDGEENALPVLSNRMLVTETLPMWLRSGQTKTFTLDKLKNNTSTSLKNHNLTLEITSNPAWYAVQALPYLMEYPYECSEQTFSRYYANALGSHIANSNPRIQEVFNQWKSSDALLSNLEKNQELKSLIIQETPWLRDAQSETEQKKRIALLFDLNKMNNELASALR